MTATPGLLRPLIVEDNPCDAELMTWALGAYGYELSCRYAVTEAEFESNLGNDIDVILCDNALPGFSPERAIERVRARGLSVPLIVVTGSVSDEDAMKLLRLGADDYLIKDRLVRLGPAVAASLRRSRMERELADRERRLAYLAHHDTLTGLPNRALFNDRLEHTLAQAQRNHRTVAVFVMDIDRFGAVNEVLGHTLGDEVLKTVGARISNCIRSGDTAARLSGDEFAVILTEVADARDAALVAEKMLDALAAPIEIRGQIVYAGASIGIALYPGDHTCAEGLMQRAHTAMYRAKSVGRGRYQFYTAELDAFARERLRLEHSLRGAARRGEFLLLYQPKLEIATLRVVGVEALMRWQPRPGALVTPDRFIPILEESGLIVEAGAWAVRAACAQLRAWFDAGLGAVPIAVNVSAKQLDRAFVEYVSLTLAEFELEPAWLELEITESSVMQNPVEAVETLAELKRIGVRVSMDDFGTGHSSLGYLRRLPVDCVKIDRGFVTEIATDADDAAIARTIIELAHHLGLRVVAEGVETQAQLSILAANGCDQMQGYLFAPPLAAGEVTEMLRSSASRPWTDKFCAERGPLM